MGTRSLINGVILADQSISFRVQAQNAKLRTAAKTALSEGLKGLKGSGMFSVEVEAAGDEGVRIMVNGQSQAASSLLKMQPSDVQAILTAFASNGADKDDSESTSDMESSDDLDDIV